MRGITGYLRSALLAALLAVISALPATAIAQKEGPADTRFKQIYTREWAWREIQNGPQGDDDDGSTRSVPAHLPKVDAATQAAKQTYWTDVLSQLASISPIAAHLGPEPLAIECPALTVAEM